MQAVSQHEGEGTYRDWARLGNELYEVRSLAAAQRSYRAWAVTSDAWWTSSRTTDACHLRCSSSARRACLHGGSPRTADTTAFAAVSWSVTFACRYASELWDIVTVDWISTLGPPSAWREVVHLSTIRVSTLLWTQCKLSYISSRTAGPLRSLRTFSRCSRHSPLIHVRYILRSSSVDKDEFHRRTASFARARTHATSRSRLGQRA